MAAGVGAVLAGALFFGCEESSAGVRLKLLSHDRSKSVPPIDAGEGKIFLVTRIAISNDTAESIPIAPGLYSVEADTGARFTADAASLYAPGFCASSPVVDPGGKRECGFAFKFPISVKPAKLIYTDEITGAEYASDITVEACNYCNDDCVDVGAACPDYCGQTGDMMLQPPIQKCADLVEGQPLIAPSTCDPIVDGKVFQDEWSAATCTRIHAPFGGDVAYIQARHGVGGVYLGVQSSGSTIAIAIDPDRAGMTTGDEYLLQIQPNGEIEAHQAMPSAQPIDVPPGVQVDCITSSYCELLLPYAAVGTSADPPAEIAIGVYAGVTWPEELDAFDASTYGVIRLE